MKLSVLLVAVLCATTITLAEGDANFFLGQKYLDKGDWEPLEEQSEVGVEVSFAKPTWPVRIAIDYFGSTEEKDVAGITFRGTTAELGVGLRKVWKIGDAHPYLGGGVASIYAQGKGSAFGLTISDDGSRLGAWLGAGVFWRLGQRFNLGLAGRYSRAKV